MQAASFTLWEEGELLITVNFSATAKLAELVLSEFIFPNWEN